MGIGSDWRLAALGCDWCLAALGCDCCVAVLGCDWVSAGEATEENAVCTDAMLPHHDDQFGHVSKTVWPSGLRRWLQAPVRKGVGSNPTAVIFAAPCV